MNVDVSNSSLTEQIKFAANLRKCSIKQLGEDFNKLCGTSYSVSSFSRKLNKGRFDFDELKAVGEILGFKVKLELIDKESG